MNTIYQVALGSSETLPCHQKNRLNLQSLVLEQKKIIF